MIVALVALMAALSGTSFAIGRTSTGTISACRNAKTGVLMVKAKCGNGETALSWNAAGTPGATGAAGAQGAAGTTGPQGAMGATGAPGSATAYGHVYSEPLELDSRLSHGFTTLTRPMPGVYCLGVTDALQSSLFATTGDFAGKPIRPAVASIDISYSSIANQKVYVDAVPQICPAYTYEVITAQGMGADSHVDFTIIVA